MKTSSSSLDEFRRRLSATVTKDIEDAKAAVSSSEDEYTPEEIIALLRTKTLKTLLGYDPLADEIKLPKQFRSVDSCASKNLVGNGRKLNKKEKNCVGISNAKKKNKVARSTKCKKQRAIKV